MFVVKIENDEATLFRAFHRRQAASLWASQQVDDNRETLYDIFDVTGSDDPLAAVTSVRHAAMRTTPAMTAGMH